MAKINYISDRYLLTLICHQEKSKRLIEKAFQHGAATLIKTAARGMLRTKHPLFKPSISPLLDVIEIILPQSYVDELMEELVKYGRLFIHRNGAIYQIPIPKLHYHPEENFYTNHAIREPTENLEWEEVYDPSYFNIPETIFYQKDLISITCIVQQGKAETIAKRVMNMGSAGPYIYYVQGKGLRDWLGLLRIAINPNRELIEIVVGQSDSERIFEGMVDEGKLDLPGMGFIYTKAVKKAIMNLPSTIDTRYAASMEQVIKAVDEIKGGTEWRVHDYMDYELTQKNRNYLYDQSLITVVCNREYSETITQAVISAGAPGSTITMAQEYACSGTIESSAVGIPISQEKDMVEIVADGIFADEILAAILKTGFISEPGQGFFYTIPIPRALTYLG